MSPLDYALHPHIPALQRAQNVTPHLYNTDPVAIPQRRYSTPIKDIYEIKMENLLNTLISCESPSLEPMYTTPLSRYVTHSAMYVYSKTEYKELHLLNTNMKKVFGGDANTARWL